MLSILWRKWRETLTANWNGPRRRRSSTFKSLDFAECLENRCVLSAVTQICTAPPTAVLVSPHPLENQDALAADSDVEANTTALSKRETGRAKKPVLNVAGQWTIVTHAPGFDVAGILNLQQKGKRVTGTLTNELQPAQKFKGRVVSTTPNGGEVKVRTTNLALASEPIGCRFGIIGQNHQTVFHTKTGDVNADGHKIV